MQSTITFSREDEDLLLVTMKFTFAGSKDAVLRKRLANQHFRLYPLDKAKINVSECVVMTGQANSSIHNEFVIKRHYEISRDFEENEALAKEHAEKYYQRVIGDLKGID